MSTWVEDQAQLGRYIDGEYKQIRSGSWHEWFSSPDLRLIPPLAEASSLYGEPDTIERARRWALAKRFLLAEGPPTCAHGLLMMRCPRMTADCCPEFDHTEIWVPYDEPQSPFILTHPYKDEIPGGIRTYARAHGLDVTTSRLDRWYHQDTLPIRLTVTSTGTYSWPLDTRAIVLKDAFAVKWPDDDVLITDWVAGGVA